MPKSDILLINSFYPRGLTEEKAHKYYIRNGNKIIKESKGHPILTFIYTDTNQYVVRRNDKDGKPFILTIDNFERIIHPRVVGLSVEIPPMTSYWCLDIDAKEGVNERHKQECVHNVIEFLKKFNEVESHQVTTSSTSYHIYAHLFRKQHITSARSYVKKQLLGYFGNQYRIDSKSKTGAKINIDLSPMSKRGSHTLLYALNLNGLKCVDVTDKYYRFNRRSLIIR